ncbi:MAG: hypothetical protein EON58_15260 [Alphaproteobacteria bacterium]|nr:MAG: hypothetical protein EON58_15260 [Alphaproteobacteria bacterium]
MRRFGYACHLIACTLLAVVGILLLIGVGDQRWLVGLLGLIALAMTGVGIAVQFLPDRPPGPPKKP